MPTFPNSDWQASLPLLAQVASVTSSLERYEGAMLAVGPVAIRVGPGEFRGRARPPVHPTS